MGYPYVGLSETLKLANSLEGLAAGINHRQLPGGGQGDDDRNPHPPCSAVIRAGRVTVSVHVVFPPLGVDAIEFAPATRAARSPAGKTEQEPVVQHRRAERGGRNSALLHNSLATIFSPPSRTSSPCAAARPGVNHHRAINDRRHGVVGHAPRSAKGRLPNPPAIRRPCKRLDASFSVAPR